MTKLALLGGDRVFDEPLYWPSIWPPVDDITEARLIELYRSRRWTAFDATEGMFAEAFAAHHHATHGIFMMNGTVTLQCALAAYGIGSGDEVIVPALTWYATAMAAHYLNATPVFVDVQPDTLCIDPSHVEAAITDRTKAIIPVHLYGSMADMEKIMRIARSRGLRVIEDCAHAHGGQWQGQALGSLGDVGSFSFQQSKTMASGEGGICITSDADIAERLFRLKHIGYGPSQVQDFVTDKPPPDLVCYPFRATAFQALLLHEQLKSLDARLDRYAEGARYLEERLGNSTHIRFQARGRKATRQSYYGLALIFDHPAYAAVPLDSIQKAIAAEGMLLLPSWGPVYDYLLFNLRPSSYRIAAPCPVAERAGRSLLWLHHAYLGLDEATLSKLADAIEKVVRHLGALSSP